MTTSLHFKVSIVRLEKNIFFSAYKYILRKTKGEKNKGIKKSTEQECKARNNKFVKWKLTDFLHVTGRL